MVEVPRQAAPALTARGRAARLLADPPELAVLAACAVVLALRRAGALTNPQFWAEDAYFFQRAYVLGWRSFLESFAGYLHTVPRIIAEAAVCIDPSRAPAIFVACAGAATLYVAGRTLSGRCPLPPYAGACALAVVLVPDTFEVFLTVVNLQWVLAAGLILLLVSRDPVRGRQWAHDVAAAALTGLTGPFCVILAPLFAWRAWNRRTRASAILAAVIVACALVQAYFFVTEPRIAAGVPVDPRINAQLFLPAIARRIGGSILMGSLMAPETDLYVGTVMGIATLAGVGYMAFRPGPLRGERGLLGLAFAAMLLGAFVRTRHTMDGYFEPHVASRYAYIPQLAAIWLLVLTAGRKGLSARIAAALLVLALAANIPRLREPAFADLHWGLYAPRIRAGERVVVPVNPPGWQMTLPARKK
jgi:hypothetical protein